MLLQLQLQVQEVLLGCSCYVYFGLSTIPAALFFLGFFVGFFKQSNLRDIFIKNSFYFSDYFGIYIAYKGYEYIIDPTKSILNCHI